MTEVPGDDQTDSARRPAFPGPPPTWYTTPTENRTATTAIGRPPPMPLQLLQGRRRGPTTWVFVLLALGVAQRLLRYLLRFPVWGDEAFVCLNLMDRDFVGLLRPLRFDQVVPLLFLWGEEAVYRILGGSELALRLLPL